jgi:ferritin-like protein
MRAGVPSAWPARRSGCDPERSDRRELTRHTLRRWCRPTAGAVGHLSEGKTVDCERPYSPDGVSPGYLRGVYMSNEGYHEPTIELTDATRDMHRAIVSLMEELEAVDWYNQRVDACKDPTLRAILAHNRDEEKEHAAMLLEWIRRTDGTFEKEMRDYLFTDKPLTHD